MMLCILQVCNFLQDSVAIVLGLIPIQNRMVTRFIQPQLLLPCLDEDGLLNNDK